MKDKKIIINADDCGKDIYVDSSIKDAILEGKISSTSIMANMRDFDGAVKLYKEFCDQISFGWHINLTEGEPLIQSQLLLDSGYFIEKEGIVYLNGKSFYGRQLQSEQKIEIRKELIAQYSKLRDYGIEVSHADGHHHIHMSPSMIGFMPSLFKELGITRCRHKKNYGMSAISYFAREMWSIPFKIRGITMPDTLGDFTTYYNNPLLRQGTIVELECHPGHPNLDFQQEMKLVYTAALNDWGAKLITYRDL